MEGRTFIYHADYQAFKTITLVLIFSQNDAVEVAADKVTQHDAYIDAEDLKGVGLEEGYRHCAIVEGVGHAVGEAAYEIGRAHV